MNVYGRMGPRKREREADSESLKERFIEKERTRLIEKERKTDCDSPLLCSTEWCILLLESKHQ
jgi:hypothetical protein